MPYSLAWVLHHARLSPVRLIELRARASSRKLKNTPCRSASIREQAVADREAGEPPPGIGLLELLAEGVGEGHDVNVLLVRIEFLEQIRVEAGLDSAILPAVPEVEDLLEPERVEGGDVQGTAVVPLVDQLRKPQLIGRRRVDAHRLDETALVDAGEEQQETDDQRRPD